MYARKYSLKTRYNFNKVLKYGLDYKGEFLIIKYLKEDRDFPSFGIIASSKFSKSAVIKNEAKRLIGESIRLQLDAFPSNYLYVFVPKKNILGSDGKLKVNVEDISTEINTFLSKMVLV